MNTKLVAYIIQTVKEIDNYTGVMDFLETVEGTLSSLGLVTSEVTEVLNLMHDHAELKWGER